MKKKQAPVVPGTAMYLEKDQVGVFFCHYCHGLMLNWNHDFVIDRSGEKDHSFLGTHSHKSVIPVVLLGMLYPISLAVGAGRQELTRCFVTCIYAYIWSRTRVIVILFPPTVKE